MKAPLYDETVPGAREDFMASLARNNGATHLSYLEWSQDPDQRAWAARMATAYAVEAEAWELYARAKRARETASVA